MKNGDLVKVYKKKMSDDYFYYSGGNVDPCGGEMSIISLGLVVGGCIYVDGMILNNRCGGDCEVLNDVRGRGEKG